MLQKTVHAEGSEAPVNIGILPIPGFALTSYACTVEPLRAANLLAGQLLYRVHHFGKASTTASSGMAHVECSHAVGADVPMDMLLVVAGVTLLPSSTRIRFAGWQGWIAWG